ncbi:putative adenosine kinase [Monocercomonoides exilis]|uniref:putative adenosine kinase n=1 Tax=Monocercomonoides exilis TaxID=2049356 RepID=UPI003559B43A|nr:putative adenosine kinase [Monocercomonoides exilis]|eukprot:MONOS_15498.1-p1 / transcript=MONOS_15498.1 / gene=MONOS_15498 / organism=Monocercomonoides_exilis_PA203 / gene_product=adenosine kinase / transcript_product=adenosine kinase / location=Mono_scaffold01251:4491-6129(+) / protein_length=497 / sequence_SO=supercontig / SO=protein_coding / is_pseudo=false
MSVETGTISFPRTEIKSVDESEEVDPSESPLPISNAPLFRQSSRQFLDHLNSKKTATNSSQSCLSAHSTFELTSHFSQYTKRRKRYAVLAISDALMDVVLRVSEAQLSSIGLTKGASFPIDEKITEKILDMMNTVNAEKCPGGSPTNTIFSCSSLGLKCAYVGCVGNDENGYDYINSLRTNEIDTYVSIKKGCSAVCYTFITPDGQRSFGLDFGVTKQLEEYEILHSLIEEAQFLHFSAYELRGDTPLSRATMHAIEHARLSRTQISIDMGDAFLIEVCFDKLMELFKERLDIIFANEDEANAFCRVYKERKGYVKKETLSTPFHFLRFGSFSSTEKSYRPSDEDSSSPSQLSQSEKSSSQASHSLAISTTTQLAHIPESPSSPPLSPPESEPLTVPSEYEILLNFCDLLIVKLGERGSIAIRRRDKGVVFCPAYKVDNVLDTNGAGDNFQAGFFYGYFRGLNLFTSLKIGSFLASKVIRRRGAQPTVQISGIEYLI